MVSSDVASAARQTYQCPIAQTLASGPLALSKVQSVLRLSSPMSPKIVAAIALHRLIIPARLSSVVKWLLARNAFIISLAALKARWETLE